MSVTVTFSGTITGPTASNLNSAGYTYTPGNPWFYAKVISVKLGENDDNWVEFPKAYAYVIFASKASPTYKYLFDTTIDDNSQKNYIRNLYNNVSEGLPYSGPKIAITKTPHFGGGFEYKFYSRGKDGVVKDILDGDDDRVRPFCLFKNGNDFIAADMTKYEVKFNYKEMYNVYPHFPVFESNSLSDSQKEAWGWLLSSSLDPNTTEPGAGGGGEVPWGPGSGGSGITGDTTEPKGDYQGFLVSGGLTSIYILDAQNFTNLGKIISAGWLAKTLADWAGGTGNIKDAIIDIKGIMTPGKITVGATEQIASYAGLVCNGQHVAKQGQIFDFGTISISEYFYSFLDYAPNTTIKIYLPYCGMYDLDASIVMNSQIHLRGVIDMITGNILYMLDVTKGGATRTLYSWNGNSSCELPITADDYGRKVTAMIATAGTVAATIAAPGIGTVAALGGSLINYAQQSNQYITAGSLTSNNGFGGVQYPYIIITRPIPQYPTNYAHTIGKPCMKAMVLGSCSGFTQVESPHMSHITSATEEELSEISSLLQKGVIL